MTQVLRVAAELETQKSTLKELGFGMVLGIQKVKNYWMRPQGYCTPANTALLSPGLSLNEDLCMGLIISNGGWHGRGGLALDSHEN